MVHLFPKLIELDDLSPQGEPTIQIVRAGEYNHLHHVKTASDTMEYVKSVRPVPGRTIILVLAMTAGEFYGPNRNGDAWPERPLIAGGTRLTEDDVLPRHYKTFETDANVFKHHINKDPLRKIGDVLKAFYNWPMHRVELLLSLDNRKASDIVERIENDEFPAVSMGCKVKYDVCSICGNKAPTRKQYCDHAKYHLGELLPSGKKIFVWNPSPRFFDISIVRRPADRVGFMMKKVAEAVPEIRSSAVLGEYVEDMGHKIANLRKLSLIDKVMKGEIAAAQTDDGTVKAVSDFGNRIAKPAAAAMPSLDDSVIRQLLRYRPAEVLSTLSSMGIFMTTPEFIKFFAWKMDPNVHIPEGLLDRAVAVQGAVFDFLADNPDILDEIDSTGFLDVCPQNVNPTLAKKAESLLEKRSQLGEYLKRKLVPDIFGDAPPTRGNWDVIDVTDPHSGRTFQTTRWAQQAAQDAAGEEQLRNLVGGGALFGGALALTPFRGLRMLAPAMGMRGAAQAYQGYRGYPYVESNQGDKVYTSNPEFFADQTYPGTELVEKRSHDLDETNMAIKLALDYAHRPRAKTASVDPNVVRWMGAPSLDAAIQRIGRAICLQK